MASKRSSAKSKQPAKQSSLLFSFDNVNESKLIEDFVEQSYLDYSMYVILDRALPRVADGLKPVQRRIVYAMSELGLNALAKYKKSARTVGDVIGKFHPHGDSAVYEAMVLMAQSFSYRHPLIDGQGNWGVQDDPKSFAAMRYTESKLTKYSEILLKEANLGTVDWRANFDGTMEEPAILPARLPNILLNGASGIAVGMATDIPPHNIREVVAACIHLLNNPKASTVELFDFIPAPDFPTRACIITPKQDLLAMYESGSGSVKQRSIWVQENANIIIQELPYHVSGSKVLEQIAAQIEAKKLPMVVNVRDESDHENPTRLVIEPRSNRIDIDQLMAHLFATTDLEKSYRINLNAIGLNGKPHVFNLRDILVEWLAYRKITVTRRMEYRLGKVEERLHILEGLLIAFLNIDEVIRIIRNEDEPKPVLMKTFKGLTEVQAESILNLRLRNLARLEEMKITSEQNELAKERDYLSGILKSPTKLKNLIIKELEEDAETHGDDRRSPLTSVNNEAKAFNEMDLISSEPVTIVLSSKGWIRAAKGHEVNAEELNYKDGDEYLCSVMGKTNDHLCVLDNTGRSYSIGAHTLPSARGFGEPLSSSVTPPAGATFIGMVMSANENDKVLVASNFGYGFIATVADFVAKNKKGKGLINCGKEAKALAPYLFKDASQSADQLVVVTSSDGYLLTFTADELPQLSKGKGNKLINIPAARLKSGEESVVATVVCNAGESVVIHSGKRFMKLSFADLAEYQSERAKRGKKLPKGFQQVQLVEVEKK